VQWQGLWLLAVSAVSPVFAQVAATPSEVPQPPSGESATGPGLRWQVPPIVWGGSIGYDLRVDRTGSSPYSTQQLLTTTLNALTYIYQPWFALVSGSVGVTQGRGSGGYDGLVDHDQFITGAVRLGVFPRSRFPLEVRYEVSDSRTDTSLGGGVDYRSRNFAITQRYRPPAGEFNLSATYERRAQEGAGFGEDTQESLMADFSSRWKRHALSASASRSVNRRQLTDEEIDFRTVIARHAYTIGSELTVETGANWAQSDEQLLLGPNSTQVAQWSSVAMWRPEGQGLTVSASARGFTFESEQQGRTETLGVGLGASYELTRNLRLNGNATVTRTDGTTATVWVGALSGSYQGDTLKLGDANYNWYGSASASQSRTRGLEDNTVSSQLGHTLSRAWPLDNQSTLTGNLGQTLSASYSFGDTEVPGRLEQGLSRALTHTAGLTWNTNAADHSAYARLSLSDARQLDGEQARFQLLNLQVSGTYELDRFRSWSGDMTIQHVYQRSLVLQVGPQAPSFGYSEQTTYTASGEITWRQQRLFGVPRLRYQSRLRLSLDARRQSNELFSVADREDASWENRVDYQIGRLDTSGSVRVSRTDGLWRGLMQLRVQRNF